jgi:nucleotide-binding universal stress UspA family protein
VHVLIASDGSRSSVATAADAIAFLAPPDRVTLLTVLHNLPVEDYDEFDEPLQAPDTQSQTWDNAIREANRELERAAASVAAAHVDQRVEAGDVAPTICNVAREIAADVIVIGPHMRGRFRRRFLTSVAERVVRDAPCAVLVAKENRDEHGT